MKKLILFALMLCMLCALAYAEKAEIAMGGKLGLMYVGDSVTLRPRTKGVSAAQLAWQSSDESVAVVSAGTIVAKAPGRTVITASFGDIKAQCGVVVLPKSVEIEVGMRYMLPNGTLERYAVKDKSIASISSKGEICGVKAGDTIVGIKYGKQTMFVDVKVKDGWGSPDQSAVADLVCAASAKQIILVEQQSGSRARLSIHEKRNGLWKELYSCTAYIGKNGIGKTREGDGKTPSGTYNLTQPFGIKADPGSIMPYTQATDAHYWCGSSDSPYYNMLIDTRKINRKRTSSDEHIIDYKGAYNYCMFIDYNAEGEAGKGSCIFLHCYSGKEYTGGCVSVPEAVMKKLVQWTKSGAKIVIR